MTPSIIPKLSRILTQGRDGHGPEAVAKMGATLAVLTGLVYATVPVAAHAAEGPQRIQTVSPGQLDDGTAASFARALEGKRQPNDAALMRAILAARVAEKRVLVEALRAGVPAETVTKGLAPYEKAVSASYEVALRDDSAHADLINAVKARMDAEHDLDHQADLIAGVEQADAPSP